MIIENFASYTTYTFPHVWTPKGELDPVINQEFCSTLPFLFDPFKFHWEYPETTEESCLGWAGICNDGTIPGASVEGSATLPPVCCLVHE